MNHSMEMLRKAHDHLLSAELTLGSIHHPLGKDVHRVRAEVAVNIVTMQSEHHITEEEKDLIQKGKHIFAIKLIRDRTGFDLKTSKGMADRYREATGVR